MNPHDEVMQVMGEPPVAALREHGVLVADGVIPVCATCRDHGRLTVLMPGEGENCVQCRDRVRQARPEFCPCGGRLDADGRCENECR